MGKINNYCRIEHELQIKLKITNSDSHTISTKLLK